MSSSLATNSPSFLAPLIVSMCAPLPDEKLAGRVGLWLGMCWTAAYKEGRKFGLSFTPDLVRSRLDEIYGSESLSFNDLLRMFGALENVAVSEDLYEAAEIKYPISRKFMDDCIRNSRLNWEENGGRSEWLEEEEIFPLRSARKRRSKKTKEEKRRRHERAKQRKLNRKRAKR